MRIWGIFNEVYRIYSIFEEYSLGTFRKYYKISQLIHT